MKIFICAVQTLLLLLVFGLGSILPAVHMLPLCTVSAGPNRVFVLDGLVLMLVFYLIFLGIDAALKRLRSRVGLTTLALVLALSLGLAMKFGFKSA